MNVIDEDRAAYADLERRLRVTCRAVIPELLDDASGPDVGDLISIPVHRRRPTAADRGRGRTALAAAALVAALVGGLALVARQRDVPDAAAPVFDTPLTAPAPTPAGTLPIVDPLAVPVNDGDRPVRPWDPIAIAPGTPGWYELDTTTLPGSLRERLGPDTSWDAEYAAGFFRCASWTITDAGPVCEGLSAGYRGVGNFGEESAFVSIGTGIGATETGTIPTVTGLAWDLANGSLWGYETFDSPPAAVPTEVAGAPAASYREGDHAYLVWSPQPGVFTWIHSRGWSAADVAALATHVRPVTLPDELPLTLALSGTDVQLGWLGGRPCVGIAMWSECTPIDSGPVVLIDSQGVGQNVAFASVVPAGRGYVFEVERFGTGEYRSAASSRAFGVANGQLGFEIFYEPPSATERIVSVRLVDGAGRVVGERPVGIEEYLGGTAPDVVAEGTDGDQDWIVTRQDPDWAGEPATVRYAGDGYCWLLFGTEGMGAPVCPPADPPATGLGTRGGHTDRLDLIEVAADVTVVTCDGVTLTIHADPKLDGRRFVVTHCADPVASTG